MTGRVVIDLIPDTAKVPLRRSVVWIKGIAFLPSFGLYIGMTPRVTITLKSGSLGTSRIAGGSVNVPLNSRRVNSTRTVRVATFSNALRGYSRHILKYPCCRSRFLAPWILFRRQDVHRENRGEPPIRHQTICADKDKRHRSAAADHGSEYLNSVSLRASTRKRWIQHDSVELSIGNPRVPSRCVGENIAFTQGPIWKLSSKGSEYLRVHIYSQKRCIRPGLCQGSQKRTIAYGQIGDNPLISRPRH